MSNLLYTKITFTYKKEFFPLSFFNTVRTLIFVAHDLIKKMFSNNAAKLNCKKCKVVRFARSSFG